MICGELKRRIKPEMYALSTLIFAVVLIVLLLVNYTADQQKQIQQKLQNRRQLPEHEKEREKIF